MNRKIMAVNAGSSSLKFQLLNMTTPENGDVLVEGLFERIGLEISQFTVKYPVNGETVKEQRELKLPNHGVAVEILIQTLIEKGIVKSLAEISGVGHRILHGGRKFTASAILNDEIIAAVEECCDLGPLHNPANLMGIRAFRKVLPNVVQVGVFDTAFHQTMEPEAYLYALPYSWYEKYGVRKYGFHGTSHNYVSEECAKVMHRPLSELKIVTAHIGNGASLAAVKYGKCVDTSMGLTPLEGVPMGSRSGSIDPAVVEFICGKEGLDVHEVNTILNKKSGYLGLYPASSDARDLRNAAAHGNDLAQLVLSMQAKHVVDYISSYYGYMGGMDALVFTAGIGEKSPEFRADVCARLHDAFGVEIDLEANKIKGELQEISTPNSKIRVFVIPTNEELMIARDVIRLSK